MVVRSEAQWLELFKKHEASGLKAAQFCRDENLCQRYFSKRKIQLGWSSKNQPKSDTKKSVADFIQVSVTNSQSNLSLEYGSLKLNFNELPPTAWLAELIKTFE